MFEKKDEPMVSPSGLTAMLDRVGPRAWGYARGVRSVVCLLACFTACELLSISASWAAGETTIDILDFQKVQLREDGSKESVLKGAKANVVGNEVRIHELEMSLFEPDGDLSLAIKAPYCVFFQDRGVARGDGPISAGGTTLTLRGTGYVVNAKEQTLTINSQVRVTIERVVPKVNSRENTE